MWDPIKYVPLNDRGDWYLSFGGQARYRYERFDDLNFNPPGSAQDDDGYHLFRLLGHVDAHFGPHLRGFLQLKGAWVEGREGGPRGSAIPGNFISIDEDVGDIQQAFIDLTFPVGQAGVLLRGGRQDLLYGAQRLISPLDWANTRRTFEGARASVAYGRHTTDLFLVRPVLMERFEANTGDDDTTFGGIYHVTGLPELFENAASRIEAYALGLFTRPDAPGAAEQDRYTLGARFYTNPKPWDFDMEAAYQFGTQGRGDISAWMFATEVGYTLTAAPMTPRLNIALDIASGDRDPDDADVQTFNQLFPLGHAYLGYIDAIGRQNIIDLHAGLALTPIKNVKFTIDYHLFWRQSDQDAVYNAGGGVLRPDSGSTARFIGSEIDLLLNWQIGRHLTAYVGYSHFLPGDFITETGPSDDIDFFYAAAQYTF